MIWMFLFFITNLLIAFFAHFFRKKTKLFYLFVTLNAIALAVFLTIKSDSVGIDTKAYANNYLKLETVSFSQIMSKYSDKGYYFFAKLFSLAKIPWVVFLLIVNSVGVCGIVFFGIKFSKNWFIYYTLFLSMGHFSLMFSGIRQSISISLFLMSLCVLFPFSGTKKKKIISVIIYYLISFISFSFHSSALIVFLVPLCILVKRTIIASIITLLMIILVWSFGPQIYSNIWLLLSQDYGPFDNRTISFTTVMFLGLTVSHFLYFDYFRQFKKITKLNIKNYFLTFDLFNKAEEQINNNYWLVFMAGLSVLFMSSVSANATTPRMHYYFDVFLFLLISNIELKNNIRLDFIRKALVVALSIAVFIYTFILNNPLGVPYAFR